MALTALITGGSAGIGQAIAQLLAQKGYNLALTARNLEDLEKTAQSLRSLGREVFVFPADVREPEQVQTFVDKALGYFGQIDVLVNNAGIYSTGPVEQFSLADWHQVIDTNLWGYLHTIHALLPHFLTRGSGTIVNLSSIGGKVPVPYTASYCTSKFAVTGLTESLHAELKPKGIHVCGIYPNIIRTSFLERAVIRGQDTEDHQARQRQLEQVLSVPVVEKPEDVAQAVWDAIAHQKAEVIVGSANLATASYHLFPGLMQWIFRRTFQNGDRL